MFNTIHKKIPLQIFFDTFLALEMSIVHGLVRELMLMVISESEAKISDVIGTKFLKFSSLLLTVI